MSECENRDALIELQGARTVEDVRITPFAPEAEVSHRAPPGPSLMAPTFPSPQPRAVMRIAVVFDTPYDGWDHPDHERQMTTEVAAWKHDEPEMEYQIADALRRRGHEVYLLGVRNDLDYLVASLGELRPDLVFNAVEAFHGDPSLEYLVPGMLEAEGYPYTGSPPLALLVSRNKAMSKKVLAFHGIRVPGFVDLPPRRADRGRARPPVSAHREALADRRVRGDRPGVGRAGSGRASRAGRPDA